VFERRVLRRTFGPKTVTGCCRKMHNVELHILYSSTDTVRMAKSSKEKWVGHVAYMEEMRNAYKILVGNSESMRLLGSLGVNGRIILKRILKK
jgi:hypothetical protein